MRELSQDQTPDFDILELRLDGIEKDDLEEAFELSLRYNSWLMPILITARDSKEGGLHKLSLDTRAALIEKFIEVADYVDIEAANYDALKTLCTNIQSEHKSLILSYHNFDTTPQDLEYHFNRAAEYNADIVKMAFMHHHVSDISRCSSFLAKVSQTQKTSLMGMGALAPVSRILYAQLGSVLNYGYLGKTPTAPGQWSAAQLKQAIASCSPLHEA